MRFPFVVKHNGVYYDPGALVPIGEEPVKENQVEDKSASELSKELKEKFGIDMAPQKGKAKLQEALAEAEEQARNEEETEPEAEGSENEEVIQGQLQLDLDQTIEPEDEEATEDSEDESFLDKIINE